MTRQQRRAAERSLKSRARGFPSTRAHRYARDRGDRLVGGAPPWGKLLADEVDARSIERGPDGFARRTP